MEDENPPPQSEQDEMPEVQDASSSDESMDDDDDEALAAQCSSLEEQVIGNVYHANCLSPTLLVSLQHYLILCVLQGFDLRTTH